MNVKRAIDIVETLYKTLDASDSYAKDNRSKDEVLPSCWEICNGNIRESLEELEGVLRGVGRIIMAKHNRQTPKTKAKRRYNKMVDYCQSYYGECEKCPYPNQCKELSEYGVKPSDGVMFDQISTKNREVITQVLGGSSKRLGVIQDEL